MAAYTVPNSISLADVESGDDRFLVLITNQDINTSSLDVFTSIDFSPLRAREGYSYSSPVHAVNDADTLRVTIRDENANRVRVGRVVPP